MPRLPCLYLCVLLSLRCAEGTWAQRDALQRALPCPAPEDIAPCLCSVDQDHRMDVDCSQVESEDQLKQVFSAYLPFPHFYKLTIRENPNLKRLRKGDLGQATFQIIEIRNGALVSIEPEALTQSIATATKLDFYGNEISDFPFNELPLFTSLDTLQLGSNALQSFPFLSSESLKSIYLYSNSLTEVPLGAFNAVKNVHEISLHSNYLKEINPFTSSDLANLYYVHLANNELSHISEGTITLGGSQLGVVDLRSNSITTIDVGGITGLLDGFLSLHYNSLQELPEDVFRPILEEGAEIRLHNNPLGCGCDIFWLISNEAFMSQIASDPPASCYNGELLANLDPSIYEDLCSH